MRTIAMVCLGLTLGGCLSASRDSAAIVGDGPAAGSIARTGAVPSKRKTSKTREARIGKECSEVGFKPGAKIPENCRLKLEHQMAIAAELKVEGHTPEEIATIMGVTQETVLDLLTPTGAIPNEQ